MTPAEFKLQFPEFVAVADERVQLYITRSDPYFDVARWGDFYTEGVGYWVAHSLTLSASPTSTSGTGMGHQNTVTGKKVGEVQVNKSVTLVQVGMDNPYMRTGYGQEFLRLRKMVGIGALAV